MVEHCNIVSYVRSIQKKLELGEGATYAYVSTFAADLGNTVLFPSLLGGGTLHVIRAEEMRDAECFARYCRKHRIDCMKITPSHLQALVGDGEERGLVPARALVFGGEVLTREVAESVKKINEECRIYNHYGPTECSVGVLCGEVGEEGERGGLRGVIALGTPLEENR